MFCACNPHASLHREYSTSVITSEVLFTVGLAQTFWRQANLLKWVLPHIPPISKEALLLEAGNCSEARRQLPNQCISLFFLFFFFSMHLFKNHLLSKSRHGAETSLTLIYLTPNLSPRNMRSLGYPVPPTDQKSLHYEWSQAKASGPKSCLGWTTPENRERGLTP